LRCEVIAEPCQGDRIKSIGEAKPRRTRPGTVNRFEPFEHILPSDAQGDPVSQ
jgi:hypothetical protein